MNKKSKGAANMERLNVEKVFVLHVSRGYESRAQHMEKMLSRMGINFEYILDGDINSITQERLEKYFSPTGDLYSACSHTSCALKHILAMEQCVTNGYLESLS